MVDKNNEFPGDDDCQTLQSLSKQVQKTNFEDTKAKQDILDAINRVSQYLKCNN